MKLRALLLRAFTSFVGVGCRNGSTAFLVAEPFLLSVIVCPTAWLRKLAQPTRRRASTQAPPPLHRRCVGVQGLPPSRSGRNGSGLIGRHDPMGVVGDPPRMPKGRIRRVTCAAAIGAPKSVLCCRPRRSAGNRQRAAGCGPPAGPARRARAVGGRKGRAGLLREGRPRCVPERS